MAQSEIVEVSATSNNRKTNRRVLVASLSIQKVRLNIYQGADPAMIENLDSLPQENCEYDLDDKTCPDCHQEMKQIGRRLVSREAVYIPAHTVCRNVYASTYKYQHCHPNGGDKLVTAKTPSPLFNHSYISSSILATIAANKFDLAVPFNRQERMWQASNLELDSKQMANAVIKGAKQFLKPFVKGN